MQLKIGEHINFRASSFVKKIFQGQCKVQKLDPSYEPIYTTFLGDLLVLFRVQLGAPLKHRTDYVGKLAQSRKISDFKMGGLTMIILHILQIF